MSVEQPAALDVGDHVIRFSRLKLAAFGFGSLAFVALGVFLWTIADDVPRENPIFVKLLSGVCVVFFGAVGLSTFSKLLDPRPGLVINDQGILDNSSGVSGGLIAWEDILKSEELSVRGHPFLLIFVTNPEKYLNRAGPLKRIPMSLNERWYGTPLFITSKALQCDFESLKSLVESSIAARRS